MRDRPSPADEIGHPDYFVHMIEQLAEQARAIGEKEVAVHLQAIAAARRQKLSHEDPSDPPPNLNS